MPPIDVRLEDGGNRLILVSDVAGGWQAWRNGYGFFGLAPRVDLSGGKWLWISLQVIARPNHLSHLVSTYPQNVEVPGGSRNLLFEFVGPDLIAVVELRTLLERLNEAQNPRMGWDLFPVFECGRIKFELKVWIILNEEGRPGPGDVREWDTEFWSGGQIESNRRRH